MLLLEIWGGRLRSGSVQYFNTEIAFCFESLVAPRRRNSFEIHSEKSGQEKTFPVVRGGKLSKNQLKCQPEKFTSTGTKSKLTLMFTYNLKKFKKKTGQNVFISRIIITYNNGGYTDPAFFFREVNER